MSIAHSFASRSVKTSIKSATLFAVAPLGHTEVVPVQEFIAAFAKSIAIALASSFVMISPPRQSKRGQEDKARKEEGPDGVMKTI